MSTEEQIIFVVDTNQYAGNFEREMCAYLTGQVGDCGVGEDLASQFLDDLGDETADLFEGIIGSKMDEHGTNRPCEMFPTEGKSQNTYESVAIYFDEMPSDELIELMKARAFEYAHSQYNRKSYNRDRKALAIKGFSIIRETTVIQQVRQAV